MRLRPQPDRPVVPLLGGFDLGTAQAGPTGTGQASRLKRRHRCSRTASSLSRAPEDWQVEAERTPTPGPVKAERQPDRPWGKAG
ncbi:MAG: hypothetical protein LBO20_05555 [Bifidobacteriaceae bacterium]|nr:hypothetical protein [Bifidobacteriaceae bacterium]